jgi:hypothetical protein
MGRSLTAATHCVFYVNKINEDLHLIAGHRTDALLILVNSGAAAKIHLKPIMAAALDPHPLSRRA